MAIQRELSRHIQLTLDLISTHLLNLALLELVVSIRSQVGVLCALPVGGHHVSLSGLSADHVEQQHGGAVEGEDGDLNAGHSDFLASSTANELVLSRHDMGGVEKDTQSCMDHSILAIFEDSTVASEDKSGVEEERETLLSALTEMLDSVEDDDGTPFDTLPDTELLTHPERRDNSAELSLADRLRPNVTFKIKIDKGKEDESKMERNSHLFKQQSQTTFHSKDKKAEAEVEIFTSTSLVNLVKLMHPYCLKLHVEEEGDKLRNNHTLFSQEEVWKYERPSEESDEEINVVSDDEVTMKDTEEEKEGDEKRDNNNLLRSALLNGNSSRTPPSREKKRVSFGSVQVVSFDESVEKGLNEKNLPSGTVSVPLNCTKAHGNPAGSALEPQTTSSETNSDQAEVLPLKCETKAKSLSLQQYRQLRQERRPLVEKQGNYTTKWPSVSEPPKELTPILCSQGQRQNSGGHKAAHHNPDDGRSGADQLRRSQSPAHKTRCISAPPGPHPSDAKPSTYLCRSGLKRPRTESKTISAASLQPAATAHPNVTVPESKKSPVKKPTLLSSDPPNPVLLPLPVSRTTSPTTGHSSSESNVEFPNRDSELDSTRHFPGIQNESSGTPLQRQSSASGPKPEALFQEIKNKLTEIASAVSSRPPALCPTSTHFKSSSESKKPQPQRRSPNQTKEAELAPKTPPSPSPDTARRPSLAPHLGQPSAPLPVRETSSEVGPSGFPSKEPLPTLPFGCEVRSAKADSGIEAPDLTSLLEQFEETQAKEGTVCEDEPEPRLATSPSYLHTGGRADTDRAQGTQSISVEALEHLRSSGSLGSPKTLRNSPHLQTSEGKDVPGPLGTEIVLRTRLDLPARRKNPPPKAIQIIDPRPLPSKKTHAHLSELPAAHASPHMYSSVASDHDYCGPVDHLLSSATQRSRAPKLQDISKTSDELQMTTHDSSAAAAAECNKQTSTSEVSAAIRAVEKSAVAVMQHLSERPRTRSETGHNAATERGCGCAAEDTTAPCSLPTPPPSPPARGREERRYRRRSPRSDSSSSSRSSSSSSSSSTSSSSASPSPKRQKHRHKRSESSSCSSSSPSRSISRSPTRRYRWSYSRSRCSRSRSRSWSQSRSPSRSRSPSPRVCHRQWGDVYSSRESRKLRREHEIRIQKLKAIDERRVVYVGRIRKSMTHDELRERFSQFGDVECVSLHFRDRGDHYGFVTFYNMDDAFAAIDNGGKLRKPDELPFDICFGGRRQFCNSHYADLDANRDAEPSPAKSRFEDLDFDLLLKQAQKGLKS